MQKIEIQLFGGRGASSSVSATKAKPKSRFGEVAKKEEPKKETPQQYKYGKDAQKSFIDFVKEQTNVDLSKARDTQFDNRNGFNIDERELTKSEANSLYDLIGKVNKGYGNGKYKVEVYANGRYRIYLKVARAK